MQIIVAGAAYDRPFHPINTIQYHRSNILTSASFTPPPRKSWLQRLWESLRLEGRL